MIKPKANGSCDLFFTRLENRKQFFMDGSDRKAIYAQRILYLRMIQRMILYLRMM